MNGPRWLTFAEVVLIQRVVIEIGGGAHGLRDAALLDSALSRPKHHYAYGEKGVFQLGASYAEAIARNHAFVDGNKRTAFQSADIFLSLHGWRLKKSEGIVHAEMMEALAQGKLTREEAAEHFRKHSEPDANRG